MASLVLTPQNQIQRLNGILAKVESISKLDMEELITPPRPKSWNVVEVIEHLNMAYRIYVPKIDKALSQSTDVQKESEERPLNSRCVGVVSPYIAWRSTLCFSVKSPVSLPAMFSRFWPTPDPEYIS